MAIEVTAYTARVDEQGNINEIKKIKDYVIPTPPQYPSAVREIVANIVEEIGKNGGMTKDELLILSRANQAIVIPLSVATGTILDMAYSNESFAQAITSNIGATAIGVLVAGAVSAVVPGNSWIFDCNWFWNVSLRLSQLWI